METQTTTRPNMQRRALMGRLEDAANEIRERSHFCQDTLDMLSYDIYSRPEGDKTREAKREHLRAEIDTLGDTYELIWDAYDKLAALECAPATC